jgi:hypothetical protein
VGHGEGDHQFLPAVFVAELGLGAGFHQGDQPIGGDGAGVDADDAQTVTAGGAAEGAGEGYQGGAAGGAGDVGAVEPSDTISFM